MAVGVGGQRVPESQPRRYTHYVVEGTTDLNDYVTFSAGGTSAAPHAHDQTVPVGKQAGW